MSNYRNLIENALGQVARSTKWDVQIPISSEGFVNDKVLSVTCNECSIPSIKLSKITKKYKGREIPIGNQVGFESEITLSFYCDEKHQIKKFFDEWILKFDSIGYEKSYVNSRKESELKRKTIEKDLYKTIKIFQYDFDKEIDPNTDLKPSAEYTVYGCFPTNVGSISFSNETESLLQIKVNFAFTYYERDN